MSFRIFFLIVGWRSNCGVRAEVVSRGGLFVVVFAVVVGRGGEIEEGWIWDCGVKGIFFCLVVYFIFFYFI